MIGVAGFDYNTNSLDWELLHCPRDSLSTLPTPTYGTKGAVFTVCGELIINAPRQTVYDVILDFQKYHLWNSFVVDVQLPSNVMETPEDV